MDRPGSLLVRPVHDRELGLLLVLAIGAGSGEDVDHRRRLYQTLQAYPGLHLAALAREADVEEALARYHMRVLVKRGLATEIEEGGFVRYYPRVESEIGARDTVDRADKAALALLRRPVPLRMVLALLDAGPDGIPGPATMGELSDAAGVSPSTATYHVGNLEEAGIVVTERQGRSKVVQLADAKHVVDLLAMYPPPRDVVEGFIEVWDQLEF